MSNTYQTSARVVVTRPTSQGDRLTNLIVAAGGSAVHIPALEIGAAEHPALAQTFFDRLDHYHFLVFISPNAVSHSLEYFDPGALTHQTTVAIGASTASAMEAAGIPCHLYPQGSYTSEALLQLPELVDLQNKNFLIVRGNGGRGLLGSELETRGATVDYAEVYQRRIPVASKARLNDVLQQHQADLVTANSVETLSNLLSITDDDLRPQLLALQLVTGSPRVVQKAAELGFTQTPLLAPGPDDHALMQAISLWSPPPSATVHDDTLTTNQTENTMTQTTPKSDEQDQPSAAAGSPADERHLSEVADDSAGNNTASTVASTTAASADEAPAAPPPTIVHKKSGGAVAWLALLIALLTAAGAGWVWWQGRGQQEAVAPIEVPTVDVIVARVKQDMERFNATMTRQLEQQEEQLENALDQQSGFTASIRTQDRSVQTLTGQLAQMEQSISAMRGVSASVRNTWVRAETEYFLQIANTRLQLAGDVTSAIQALRAADERIVALGDPSLTPVRAQISEELLALESVPSMDIEGIALSLNSLSRRAGQLTLKNSTPGSLTRNDGTEMAKSGWGRAKGVVSNAFTDIVRITPTDDSQPALLAPEQAYFLYRNLELQLQSARIAAMQSQQRNYSDSIKLSLEWLTRFFDPADQGVIAVTARLQQLQDARVTRTVPDISKSLNMIRAIVPGSSSSGPAGSATTDIGATAGSR